MSEEKIEKLKSGLCAIAKGADDLIDDLDGLFGEIDEVNFEDSVNRLGVLVEELDNELHKI